jgi:hypothetical protein
VSPVRYAGLGGLGGLAWAAALRGWMAQLAGHESSVSWLTFLLVLLPGVAVGMLLGWAAYLRANRLPQPRRLVFAPVLFASALLDPQIFAAFVRNGEGGGSLMVVATALAGGFVLAHTGFSVWRAVCGLVAAPGLLMLGFMGTMAAPAGSPRGAWVCLYGLSLILLLCAASALAYPAVRGTRGPWSLAVLGGLCGLAWSCALRSFMAEVAGAESGVHWLDTFGFILLPGVVTGALLGWAEHLRRTGGRPHWRLLALAPLLFTAVMFKNPLDLPSFFADGIGGGAIGVPVIGILGGYAVCGRGSIRGRAAAGLVFLAGLVVWALTATGVGGPNFALTRPHGLWAALLYDALLATLALAVSIPLREPAARPGPSVPSSAQPMTSVIPRG